MRSLHHLALALVLTVCAQAQTVFWRNLGAIPSPTVSVTGDATGSLTLLASSAATLNLTLANSGASAGTYRSVTVDAKGRVTAGTNPTALTSVNSITSAALSSLTLGTGTFGTALTFASATGAATFTGTVKAPTYQLTTQTLDTPQWTNDASNTYFDFNGSLKIRRILTGAATDIFTINNVGTVTAAGRILVANAGDSNNGAVQLATHGNNTGGIGFGNASLYRDSTTLGQLVWSTNGNSNVTRFTVKTSLATSYGPIVSFDGTSVTGGKFWSWQSQGNVGGEVAGRFVLNNETDGVSALSIQNAGSASTGNFVIPFTTPATNTTSGALQIAGGLGVAKEIYAGNGVTSANGSGSALYRATQIGGSFTSQVPMFDGWADNPTNGASNIIIGGARTGDTTRRLIITADGYHAWSPGNTATDTGFGRYGVGQLFTNGSLSIQASQPQLIVGQSSAVTQIGFFYASAGQYVCVTGNRNPATGVFTNTLGTHADMAFDTGAAGSSISFRTTATPNALGNIALFINKSGGIEAVSPTGGLGYGTGAGGAVTQITSRTTGVTLNKVAGAITLFTAAGSATPASFTVTNSAIAATDTVTLSVKSSTNKYLCFVTAVAAGSFEITFYTTGGTASDAAVINFAILKSVTS